MRVPRSFGSQQSDGSVRMVAEQLGRALSQYQVTFGDSTSNTEAHSMDVWKAIGTTPGVANTEFAVAHQLLRIPWGYIVVAMSIAGDIYTSTGGTAWTAATNAAAGNIYLKCSVATLAFKIIII